MMYLSHVDDNDYTIAVELDDNFLNYIKEVKDKMSKTELDVAVVRLNFDTAKARFIEKGFYPYEDKQVHTITNGEDPLDYYRYHISKHYFPTQDYWYELKPDIVYLEMYSGSFGFSFIRNGKRYEGMAISLSDWERRF